MMAITFAYIAHNEISNPFQYGVHYVSVFGFVQKNTGAEEIQLKVQELQDTFNDFDNGDNVFVTAGLPLVREKYRALVKAYDSRLLKVRSKCCLFTALVLI